MERALVADDPKLASTMRGTTLRASARRRALVAALAFVVGVVVLMTGAVTKNTIVGVIGFVVMLVSAYVALSSWRGQHRAPSSPAASRVRTRRSASSTAAASTQARGRQQPLVVVAPLDDGALRGAVASPPRPERLLSNVTDGSQGPARCSPTARPGGPRVRPPGRRRLRAPRCRAGRAAVGEPGSTATRAARSPGCDAACRRRPAAQRRTRCTSARTDSRGDVAPAGSAARSGPARAAPTSRSQRLRASGSASAPRCVGPAEGVVLVARAGRTRAAGPAADVRRVTRSSKATPRSTAVSRSSPQPASTDAPTRRRRAAQRRRRTSVRSVRGVSSRSSDRRAAGDRRCRARPGWSATTPSRPGARPRRSASAVPVDAVQAAVRRRAPSCSRSGAAGAAPSGWCRPGRRWRACGVGSKRTQPTPPKYISGQACRSWEL